MQFALTCLISLVLVSAAAAKDKNTVYNDPRYFSNGLPIDYCLYPTKQCGHAAADRYCKDMNAGSVISFEWRRSNSGTYIQGTGETCDTRKYSQCIALSKIICGHFSL
jgi:hypothetical protein